MLADAWRQPFVLGRRRYSAPDRLGVDGMILTPDLKRYGARPVPCCLTRRVSEKFFQTPKGLVTIILVILTAMAAGQDRITMEGMASATAPRVVSPSSDLEKQSGNSGACSPMIVARCCGHRSPGTSSRHLCYRGPEQVHFRSRSANVLIRGAHHRELQYSIRAELVGRLPDVSDPEGGAARSHVHYRPGQIPLVLTFLGLISAVHRDIVCRNPLSVAEVFRTPTSRRAMLRIHHPDGSADAGQVS